MAVQRVRFTRIVMGTIVILAAIAGGLAGSWATARASWTPFGKAGEVTVWKATPTTMDLGGQVSFENGFVPVVQKVLPAVVNIASSKLVRAPNMAPLFSDPLFQQFFGNDFSQQSRAPREQREHSLGSGVIVSSDGHILTNNHVVNGASEIKVSLSNGREFGAHVVGIDAKSDLAVLKVDASNLPSVVFGDSSKMRVGDFALAIGNPFGVGETVTMGIVGATGRGGLGIEQYEDFIQTDAAINPGNSGGALVNVNGELIGINTAIVSGGGGGNQGVGFAVPVNMARNVMDQIMKNGKVTRGYLGVSAQTVTGDIATSFGLTGTPRGALVGDVASDSPASKAGLQKGDIILQLNGEPIADSRSLSLKVSSLAPNTQAHLQIWRQGKEQDVTATLAELPATAGTANREASGNNGSPALGISVETLTEPLARRLGLPAQTKGAVIDEVQSGSRADDAGLKQGDVVEEVNHKSIATADDFENAVRAGENQPVLLLVNRGGNHVYVVIERQ